MSVADTSSQSWGSYSSTVTSSTSVSDILKVFSNWASHVMVNQIEVRDDRNVLFLDVACGWGYLSTAILERLLESHIPLERCHLDITDYADGMVSAASKNMEDACLRHSITPSSTLFDCFVMDGCQPTVPASTVSRLGCMFGIMFFPDVDGSLSRLHDTLQPGGSAYFGTWKYADTAEITYAFLRYLRLDDTSPSVEKARQFLSVGQNAEEMIERLSRAGYVNIRVEEREEIFDMENSSMAIYNALVKNPVLGPCWASFQGSEEELYQQYLAFVQDEVASQQWSINHGKIMRIKMTANLFVAYRSSE